MIASSGIVTGWSYLGEPGHEYLFTESGARLIG
jgi:hypothetical protein